jgi:hypothetical protein
LGSVGRRSSSYLGREQSRRQRAERVGGRHPGLREAGFLRGKPVEHGPRSVHVVCGRILSRGREHRRQRMSGGRRGGEPRSRATFQGARTGRKGNLKTPLAPRAAKSFSRSSDPCASIVTTHRRGNSFGGGAVTAVSRSGKPTQVGGTGSGVVGTGRSAARRSDPLPQGRGRIRVRTGRWSRPSSQRGTQSLGSCPHVEVNAVCRSR